MHGESIKLWEPRQGQGQGQGQGRRRELPQPHPSCRLRQYLAITVTRPSFPFYGPAAFGFRPRLAGVAARPGRWLTTSRKSGEPRGLADQLASPQRVERRIVRVGIARIREIAETVSQRLDADQAVVDAGVTGVRRQCTQLASLPAAPCLVRDDDAVPPAGHAAERPSSDRPLLPCVPAPSPDEFAAGGDCVSPARRLAPRRAVAHGGGRGDVFRDRRRDLALRPRRRDVC
jgi:hypothetical protein